MWDTTTTWITRKFFKVEEGEGSKIPKIARHFNEKLSSLWQAMLIVILTKGFKLSNWKFLRQILQLLRCWRTSTIFFIPAHAKTFLITFDIDRDFNLFFCELVARSSAALFEIFNDFSCSRFYLHDKKWLLANSSVCWSFHCLAQLVRIVSAWVHSVLCLKVRKRFVWRFIVDN